MNAQLLTHSHARVLFSVPTLLLLSRERERVSEREIEKEHVRGRINRWMTGNLILSRVPSITSKRDSLVILCKLSISLVHFIN